MRRPFMNSGGPRRLVNGASVIIELYSGTAYFPTEPLAYEVSFGSNSCHQAADDRYPLFPRQRTCVEQTACVASPIGSAITGITTTVTSTVRTCFASRASAISKPEPRQNNP